MTSKVRVSMFPCENASVISVTSDGEGGFSLEVSTTCPKVRRYIERLGELSIDDLTNKREGKIYREFLASDMSCNCLVASGVITAAWVEAGMIAGSNARKGVPLSIEFVNDQGPPEN